MNQDEKLKIIKEIISEILNYDILKISITSDFRNDLGADSTDIFDIIWEIGKVFKKEFKVNEVNSMNNISDILKYV